MEGFIEKVAPNDLGILFALSVVDFSPESWGEHEEVWEILEEIEVKDD